MLTLFKIIYKMEFKQKVGLVIILFLILAIAWMQIANENYRIRTNGNLISKSPTTGLVTAGNMIWIKKDSILQKGDAAQISVEQGNQIHFNYRNGVEEQIDITSIDQNSITITLSDGEKIKILENDATLIRNINEVAIRLNQIENSRADLEITVQT